MVIEDLLFIKNKIQLIIYIIVLGFNEIYKKGKKIWFWMNAKHHFLQATLFNDEEKDKYSFQIVNIWFIYYMMVLSETASATPKLESPEMKFIF